jgi:sterol desaturase/sphingolipid hydroxylase (fatty acid hydroxylase superfamily)
MSETVLKERIRGDWIPEDLIDPHFDTVFSWPPRPRALLKYIFGWPGFLWPQPIAVLLFSWFTWKYLTPDVQVARHLTLGWIWPILLRNMLIVGITTSILHYLLYVRKIQGTTYKYNKRWPTGDNPSFTFRNQTLDNLFWCFVWAVPVMTAWEVAGLWLQASGYSPIATWREHPIYLTVLLLLIQPYHVAHFHLNHALLHKGPLYRWVHSVHHRNVNSGPWSGMALHPVEALLFFAPVWLFLVIPSNPLIIIFYLQYVFYTTLPSHLGFGRVAKGIDGDSFDTDHYHHYLHHRYHECNYSGTVIDRWLGTWHDGTVEAHERMKARMKSRQVSR